MNHPRSSCNIIEQACIPQIGVIWSEGADSDRSIREHVDIFRGSRMRLPCGAHFGYNWSQGHIRLKWTLIIFVLCRRGGGRKRTVVNFGRGRSKPAHGQTFLSFRSDMSPPWVIYECRRQSSQKHTSLVCLRETNREWLGTGGWLYTSTKGPESWNRLC